MFSKTCEYAIRSSIYIASQTLNSKRVSLIEVSNKIESPEAFTSKILQKMVKAKIIRSIKGPGGGFEIDKNQLYDIKINKIIEAFDGDILNQCSLGLANCSDSHPCPFHYKYKHVKEKLIDIFTTTSLGDILKGYQEGVTHLKI